MSKFGRHRSVDRLWYSVPTKYCSEARGSQEGKDFCIIQFYGKHKALCAWRNSKRCNIGMPFMCKVVLKNKRPHVKYKNQYIPVYSGSGWVW